MPEELETVETEQDVENKDNKKPTIHAEMETYAEAFLKVGKTSALYRYCANT